MPLMPEDTTQLTQLLGRAADGDQQAHCQLMEVAYDELRRLAGGMMRRERPDHTLQPTALVNEASLRMLGQGGSLAKRDRAYFFGAMATAMRRVLVDHARSRGAQRRGGSEQQKVPLDEAVDAIQQDGRLDLLSLDEALDQLASRSQRQADVVTLRFFGGLSVPDIAEHLGVSVSTVEKDWRMARAWLQSQLDGASIGSSLAPPPQ
ncbi:sigma-70 family RNA polymerase sigma factor [Aeoliella sp.]|uniref:sigma-70 family RNA polymerase sigma factor n=1 Tax=Aeoliella sp. TaxID=2795800 RepID=UPI003CCBDA08